MTTSMDQPRRHFDELLPFYVTGRISEADRQWTDHYLATHPEARAELNWHRDLMTLVVSKAEARAMEAPEMVGWAQVEAQLNAARKPPQVAKATASASPSFLERIHEWIGSLAARPLAPVAAVLILAQAGVIGTLLNREPASDTELTRSTNAGAAAIVPRDVLQVRFKQAATEHELRALLYGAGARIVDGPDQLGDYVVEPRRGALAALQAELTGSALVQSVTPLKAWKAEPRED